MTAPSWFADPTSCTRPTAGRPIPLRYASWYDTESLEHRFDIGAGTVVISCG